MRITESEVVDRQTVLHVVLQEEDLKTYLDRGCRSIAGRTSIPGFRKGRAPHHVIESYVGRDTVLNEVVDTMLPETASKAIAQQEIETGGPPSITLLGMDPVTFDATVPLKPLVDLGAYADIRVPQEEVEVGEEEVDARIHDMRQGMGAWEPADRPPKSGDLITMDATCTAADRTLFQGDDHEHVLAGNEPPPFTGLTQRLEGLPLGEVSEFDLEIPDDYEDETLAGQDAHFVVTVKEVKERILPDLDDDFAKELGRGFESLDELRENTADILRNEVEQMAERRYREAALNALLEGASFELPKLLVEYEFDRLEQQQLSLLQRFNIQLGDYLRSMNVTDQEMRDNRQNEAEQIVKRSAALEALADAESISPSDEEVEEQLQGVLADADRRQRRDAHGIRENVVRILTAERTMDRLVAIAKGQADANQDDDDANHDQTPNDDDPDKDEGGAGD